MKKIILFLILTVFCFAQRVEIIKQGCNARNIWIPASNSKPITTLTPGSKYNVVASHSDYVKVEIMEGSMHTTKIGYMWTTALNIDNKPISTFTPDMEGKLATVTGAGCAPDGWKGCWLRKKPFKSAETEFAKIKAGAKVKILGHVITYCLLQGTSESNFKQLWVYEPYTKKVE